MYDLFDEFPTPDAAYFEAANHAHDLAHWQPSHCAVFEAGRRVGFAKLRRRDTGAGKRAFTKIYQDVCKACLRGERFKRVVIEAPSFGEQLTEQELLQRRVIGRERVGQLKSLLRATT
ncbi:hypothetical protein [Marinomonas aquiplantarum]|uniref:Uncharacterized protein n=1 Tax=Marinomonas aquiplantarum TaxID=491951 RepID=A0A366CXN3_9GAMM|nr:hypothetical protein [Marinomonas aquiplantarum]RBO82600.1 hypothetical protein DFP76_10564 [Marinomonas aquiplantarum]